MEIARFARWLRLAGYMAAWALNFRALGDVRHTFHEIEKVVISLLFVLAAGFLLYLGKKIWQQDWAVSRT